MKYSVIEKIFREEELAVAAFGIMAIIILEAIALLKGMNGVMFGSAMTGVGVVVGWIFKSFHIKKTEKTS